MPLLMTHIIFHRGGSMEAELDRQESNVIPLGVLPRGISRQAAASYCGCSLRSFDDWVRKGILPGPITGTHRWDRWAIDAFLDRRSGLVEHNADDSALDQWERSRNARAA